MNIINNIKAAAFWMWWMLVGASAVHLVGWWVVLASGVSP